MKHERATQEISGLASMAALGALEHDEWSAFKAHLDEGCEVCRREFEAFQEVTGEIGLVAPAIPARPKVRDQVLESIRLTSQDRRVVRIDHFIRRSSPAAGSRVARWGAIAAMLILTFAAVLLFVQSQRELRRLQTQTFELQKQLERQREVLRALASPDHITIKLTGQGPASEARAQIVWDRQAGRWVMEAHNLPQLSHQQTFQLWFVTKDAKVSAGTFTADGSGSGFLATGVPKELTDIAAAAVSIEPAGGAPQPSGAICLLGATS